MTKPKLISKTPDDEDLNSLITNAQDYLDRPRERRFAVVELGVHDRHFPPERDHWADVKILHIEEIDGDPLKTVLEIRDRAFTARTGGKTVPQPDSELPIDELEN